MGIEFTDIIFIGAVVEIYLYVILLMRRNRLDFFKSFILGSLIAGLVIFWGLWRSDFNNIPVWIQAGATFCLLLITAMSSYATLVTAQANRELVEVTKEQLAIGQKERKSKIIISIARNVFRPILKLIETEEDTLESGNIIVHYLNHRKTDPTEKWKYPRIMPYDFLKKQVYPPDNILRKKMNEIEVFKNHFNAFYKKMDALLERIYLKQSNSLAFFEEFCNKLKDENYSFGNDEINCIFSQTIVNSKKEGHVGYKFFNSHRFELISKLEELGFHDEIEEYNKSLLEFSAINLSFSTLIIGLFSEWKLEYDLTSEELDEKF